MRIKDWLACFAIARACGRGGRREAGDFWRRATPGERKLLIAHLRSQLHDYAGRLDRRRIVAGPEAFPDSVAERVRRIAEGESIHRGSGDFLRDAGYDNPDEMREKFALANSIALVIEDRSITSAEAAALTGLMENELSRIAQGVVKEHSVDGLRRILAALGGSAP